MPLFLFGLTKAVWENFGSKNEHKHKENEVCRVLWCPPGVSRDVVSAMWGPVLMTLMCALTTGLEMRVVSLYCSIKGPNIHLHWIIPSLCYSTATWNLQLASIKRFTTSVKVFWPTKNLLLRHLEELHLWLAAALHTSIMAFFQIFWAWTASWSSPHVDL